MPFAWNLGGRPFLKGDFSKSVCRSKCASAESAAPAQFPSAPSLHACLQGCSHDMLFKVPHSDEAESSEGPFDYVLCLRKTLLVWNCRWAPVVCWASTWTQNASVLGSNPCSSTAGGVTLSLTLYPGSLCFTSNIAVAGIDLVELCGRKEC